MKRIIAALVLVIATYAFISLYPVKRVPTKVETVSVVCGKDSIKGHESEITAVHGKCMHCMSSTTGWHDTKYFLHVNHDGKVYSECVSKCKYDSIKKGERIVFYIESMQLPPIVSVGIALDIIVILFLLVSSIWDLCERLSEKSDYFYY